MTHWRKIWRDYLLVMIMLPVTVIYGGYAVIGAFMGAGTIILVLTGLHSYKTEISYLDVWMCFTGLGGSVGLIGLWFFILSRKRQSDKRIISNWVVASCLVAGSCAGMWVVFAIGYSELLISLNVFNAILLLLSIYGAYAAIILLKPNTCPEVDSQEQID